MEKIKVKNYLQLLKVSELIKIAKELHIKI